MFAIINGKTMAGRLPAALTITNNLIHPSGALAKTNAVAFAHYLLPPSMIRATEVLLPRVVFSSVAPKTSELSDTSTEPINAPAHPSFSVRQRPFPSLFNNFWRTNDVPALLEEFDKLTQTRMNRWLLSPQHNFSFPSLPMWDPSSFASTGWNNAKFDDASNTWSVPMKVPNIFRTEDIAVKVVKEPSGHYVLRITGRREMENTTDKGETNEPSGMDVEATDTKSDLPASKSNYHYEMKLHFPPQDNMTEEDLTEYFSKITSELNKDEGLLTVKIPDDIVSPNKGGSTIARENAENEIFSVPIQAAA